VHNRPNRQRALSPSNMQFSQLFISLLAAVLAESQLDKWAKAAGLKYFGTAIDNPSLNNQAYMKIARDKDEFGQITPANGQKWSNTESSQGRFNYGSGDAIANVAKQTGQLLRCHTLVWYNQLPSWGEKCCRLIITRGLLTPLSYPVSSTFNRDQMQRIITAHIQNVAGHYKGQCYSWDVVNEAFEDDGKFRQSASPSPLFLLLFLSPSFFSPPPLLTMWLNIVYRAMGLSYITHSFLTASLTDPTAKLYYNDFNIERCCNAKINATLAMVKAVQAAGARIDGIGMQGHSRVGKSPSKRELMDTMARFGELVAEVAFTEVDIRHTKLPVGEAEREQQARDYGEVVGACLETRACVGVTVWDWTDQVSSGGWVGLRGVGSADMSCVVFVDPGAVSW